MHWWWFHLAHHPNTNNLTKVLVEKTIPLPPFKMICTTFLICIELSKIGCTWAINNVSQMLQGISIWSTILRLYQTKKAVDLASSVPSRHEGIDNLLMQANNTLPTEISNNWLILILTSTIISMEYQFSFAEWMLVEEMMWSIDITELAPWLGDPFSPIVQASSTR